MSSSLAQPLGARRRGPRHHPGPARPPAPPTGDNAKLTSLLWLVLLVPLADSATTVVRPSKGVATLVPGQALHFECAQTGKQHAQFIWYKKSLIADEPPTLLDPNHDDTIQIHNERLILLRPNYQSIGDYICRALNEDKSENEKEFETIKVRAQPYIDDFGLELSHTGKSATITDGVELELMCRVRDLSVPVNITWLISNLPDDDRSMVRVDELEPGRSTSAPSQHQPAESPVPTYTPVPNMFVERVDAFARRLVIRQVGPEHRGYYTCVADNNVTDKTRKTIYIRVKDKIIALWPFLGILAELFILFTIIYVWETQRTQKSINSAASNAAGSPAKSLAPPTTPSSTSGKRHASGPSNAFESVPLNG